MVELKDGMDFHDFMWSLRSDDWKKKRKDESILDWLHRVSLKDSGWVEKFEWRKKNRYWTDVSSKIALSVLTFLRENNVNQEDLEDLCGFELDLKGSYDWKLSEIKKLELLMNKKLL